jgi:hypothetical protein
MFKSIDILKDDSNYFNYLLTDTDFKCEIKVNRVSALTAIVAASFSLPPPQGMNKANATIAIEYDKRNLPVGRNLIQFAKFDIYQFGSHINELVLWDDKYIPFYLKKNGYPNYQEKWEQWKKERDSYLIMV